MKYITAGILVAVMGCTTAAAHPGHWVEGHWYQGHYYEGFYKKHHHPKPKPKPQPELTVENSDLGLFLFLSGILLLNNNK